MNSSAARTDASGTAESNPWFLLATLFGKPTGTEDDAYRALLTKNRIAWNRWMVTSLDDTTRRSVKKTDYYTREECEPLTAEEIGTHWELIRERGLRRQDHAMLDLQADSKLTIDLAGVQFRDKCQFRGYIFPRRTSFDGATFESDATFGDALFCDYGSFKSCTFKGPADFNGATFRKWAPFHGTRFLSYANFGSCHFDEGADFEDFSVDGHADFNHVEFSESARFRNAQFRDRAVFYSAKFGYAAFQNAVFSDRADFDRSHFRQRADFQGVKFSSAGRGPMHEHYRWHEEDREERGRMPSRFWHGASFQNATFERGVDFENVVFEASCKFGHAVFATQPPLFLGASIHPGAEWRNAHWPLPETREDAGTFVDAYACLKLEMDRLKKHEDELDFFALELQSRMKLLGLWRGLPIGLYGLLSDFGRSHTRPLLGILLVWACSAVPLSIWLGKCRLNEALGLSLVNVFGVFGFRKEFVAAKLVEEMPSALKVMSAVETIIGGILLFFFGLALRNKFRMK